MDGLIESPSAVVDPGVLSGSAALERARLYHFLELALAHPGEDGFDHFRRPATEGEFAAVLARLPRCEELRVEGPVRAFFAGLRQGTFADIESAHIALFSANFPQVPCPPYGSLFLAEDDGKRLEEMLAIKQFYQANGIDIAESFDDLPDHLCVELEFLQLLCFREDDAAHRGDDEAAAGARIVQAQFLDRFLLPFAERLAQIAVHVAADNLYHHLLAATHGLLVHHRRDLDDPASQPSQPRESTP